MDPYATLGITPAFEGDLRAVRNRLVKRHFEAGSAPDEERMKAINLAYALLQDAPRVTGPLVIATERLAPARVGEPYDAGLTARGGTPPYAWTVEPPARTDRPGTFPLTVAVEDAVGRRQERVLVLHVEPQPLHVVGGALPDATIGEFYEAEVRATGGAGVLRWSGELPAGLQLGDGLLFGTPLGPPGAHLLRLRVRDEARQTAEITLELAVRHPQEEALRARIDELERRLARALDPSGIAAVLVLVAALVALVGPMALVLLLVLGPTLLGPGRRAEIERIRRYSRGEYRPGTTTPRPRPSRPA